MKKILITSILAITTSLTVYFVGFWQPKEKNNNGLVLENSKIIEDNNTERDINKEDNVGKNIDINNDDNKEEKNKKEYIDDKSLNDNTKTNKNYLNNSNNEENKTDKNSNSTSTNKKEEAQATNAKIFNINKEDIIGKLSLAEKTKLLTVVNKISTVDVEKIKDSLKKNGEKEGITEVVRVLKRRLKSDDYNEIKNILSPYINIDFLESLV